MHSASVFFQSTFNKKNLECATNVNGKKIGVNRQLFHHKSIFNRKRDAPNHGVYLSQCACLLKFTVVHTHSLSSFIMSYTLYLTGLTIQPTIHTERISDTHTFETATIVECIRNGTNLKSAIHWKMSSFFVVVI